MQFTHFNNETVAALLLHLAENDELTSLKKLKHFQKEQVLDTLKELAEQVRTQLNFENAGLRTNFEIKDLSTEAQSLISCLSPQEEVVLFKSFKVL